MTDVLLKIGGSLAVAVLTSWLTVHMTLKRFRSEKWWGKRSEAYSQIMEALHHIREHADNERAAEQRGATLAAELAKKLRSNVEKATAEIRLRRDIGSFLISEDAVAALNALLEDLNAALQAGLAGRDAEYYEGRISAADRALENLRRIAREHLQLP